MAIRKITFAPGEYYHIYNRGNSKQTIFHDDIDRLRFLQLLFLSNGSNRFNIYDLQRSKNVFEHARGERLILIGAYVLMDNHFHILVTQGERGSISKFMQKLSTGYSMYYNQKYSRTGGLFEGKFKARHVSSDRYLKYLFAYIHLNPVKLIDSSWKEHGIQSIEIALNHISTYEWSSYLDYSGERSRVVAALLDIKAFPDYFSSREVLQKEMFDWVSLRS